MTTQDIISLLESNGFKLSEENDIQHGKQIKFTNGSIINVFNSGKITPHSYGVV